jgi:hypothetical protein
MNCDGSVEDKLAMGQGKLQAKANRFFCLRRKT